MTLAPNVVEQQAIGLMNELGAAGYTLRKIAAELTRRGIYQSIVNRFVQGPQGISGNGRQAVRLSGPRLG